MFTFVKQMYFTFPVGCTTFLNMTTAFVERLWYMDNGFNLNAGK